MMEKIPINYCSYRDLATVPGVGDALATTIVDLRSAHGDMTPEMLMSVPGVRSMPDIMRMFDFKPYIPFSEGSHPVNMASPKSRFRRVPQATASAPSQMSSFQDAWSSLQGGTQKFDPLMSRFPESPYPFDSYPPHPPSPYAYSAHPREAHRLREEVRPAPFGQDAAATWLGKPAFAKWRDGASTPKHPTLPKTITYDGKSSWQAFIAKFSSYADECNWSAKQRKNNLCWCLEAKASEFYAMLSEREPNLEYFDLIKKMEKRFGLRDLPEATQMQFNYAKQSSEETILDWADRVLYMATRAFPNLPEMHVQKQVVLKFCQGCSDREAGQYAINSRPATLEAAVDCVKWFQHTQRAIYGRSRREVHVNEMSFTQEVEGVGANLCEVGITAQTPPRRPNPGDFSSLDKRMTALEDQFKSIQGSLDKLTALATHRPRERSRSPALDMSRSPCFQCGKLGHFKRDCPGVKTEKTVSFIDDQSNYSGSESEADLRPEQLPAADHQR